MSVFFWMTFENEMLFFGGIPMELLPTGMGFEMDSAFDPTDRRILSNATPNDPLDRPTTDVRFLGGAIDAEIEPSLSLPRNAVGSDSGDDPIQTGGSMDEILLPNGEILEPIDPGSANRDPITGIDNIETEMDVVLPETTNLQPILDPIVPIDPIIPIDPPIIIPPFPIFSPPNDQLWSQDSTNIEGEIEAFDNFGGVLATGDFNGDGYDDLAVGSPLEDIDATVDAGAVNIIYGSSFSGLRSTNDQIWYQGFGSLSDAAEAGDYFGRSLTSGDFNNDGYDDLAIGVPGESVGGDSGAGATHILYGTGSGLSATNNQLWHQDSLSGSSAEVGDNFGSSLTSGDFNNDGYADLGVGAAGEDWISTVNAGAVNVIYGATSGLSATGNQIWTQDSFQVEDQAEQDDRFGASLTAGDFDGDGYDDLAVGIPDEDIDGQLNAGAVNVLYGTTNRLSATDNQFWHQNTTGMPDDAGVLDNFGFSLTSGDFDGNGADDLAIGVPGEDIDGDGGEFSPASQGAAHVLYGSTSNLNTVGTQFWHQDSAGIEGVAGHVENFGWSVTSADFDNDGYDDLGVGVPGETVGAIANAGAVNVLRGSNNRLSYLQDRLMSQNTLDLDADSAEANDRFGMSLTAGDFNGDGYADLAVGVPEEDLLSGATTVTNAGIANVLYDV